MKLFRRIRFIAGLIVGIGMLVTAANIHLYLIAFWSFLTRSDEMRHRGRVYDWCMTWSSTLLTTFSWLIGCRFEFHVPASPNRDPSPAIVLMNHRSSFDALIFPVILNHMGFRKLKGVGKRGAKDIAVVGRALRHLNYAFVERKGDAADIETIRICATEAREEGACMLIFPEGTTYHDPLFVSDRQKHFSKVLSPKAGGISVLLQELPDYPVLSVTANWGDIDGADTIPALEPMVGSSVVVEAQFIPRPREDEDVQEWLNREWARKDAILAQEHLVRS